MIPSDIFYYYYFVARFRHRLWDWMRLCYYFLHRDCVWALTSLKESKHNSPVSSTSSCQCKKLLLLFVHCSIVFVLRRERNSRFNVRISFFLSFFLSSCNRFRLAVVFTFYNAPHNDDDEAHAEELWRQSWTSFRISIKLSNTVFTFEKIQKQQREKRNETIIQSLKNTERRQRR